MPHLDDCTCLDCVNRLRHDLDRAQQQVLELQMEMDRVREKLHSLADRLSQVAKR